MKALDPFDSTLEGIEESRVAQSGFTEQAGSTRTSAHRRWFRSRADLACLTLLAVAALAFYDPRLSIGVDLTDESYYATHIVEWLKNGFAGSQNRNLQQLGALLVYAPARLYVGWSGGLDGLILFLRTLYAAMTVVAAVPVFLFLRRVGPPWIAALAAAFTIAFIPFGLPAPSYNTIALCGTNAGLCLFGLGMADARGSKAARLRVQSFLAGAAAAAAATALAYPTLALAPPLLVLCVLVIGCDRTSRRIALSYSAWCVTAALVTFAMLASVFGLDRLRDMAEYTTRSAELGGRASHKFLFSFTQISHEPFAAAALIGVTLVPLVLVPRGCSRPLARLSVVFLAALAAMLWAGPVCWAKSHDIVLLAALFAPHVVLRRRREPDRAETTVGMLVLASLLAGLITLSTATNGIFNFFVGATTAAVLGLAMLAADAEPSAIAVPYSSLARLLQYLPLPIAAIAVGFFSQTTIYGEYAARRPVNPQRIATGPFAHLWTGADTQRYISDTTAALAHDNFRQTIAVMGPYAGVYLLSPSRPWAYSTYLNLTFIGPGALAMVLELYRRSPPDVIAITDGMSLYKEDTPIGRLLQQYRRADGVEVGYFTCQILRFKP